MSGQPHSGGGGGGRCTGGGGNGGFAPPQASPPHLLADGVHRLTAYLPLLARWFTVTVRATREADDKVKLKLTVLNSRCDWEAKHHYRHPGCVTCNRLSPDHLVACHAWYVFWDAQRGCYQVRLHMTRKKADFQSEWMLGKNPRGWLFWDHA